MDEQLEQLAQAVAGRLFIGVEISGRHVHLTDPQAHTLFGHSLTPQRPLSQPGQFLAKERLELVGPKGSLARVAVLGPARREAQVEISLTDGLKLGIEPPIRLSGSTQGTPGITLKGPLGELHLASGVLAAQRHIHLPPEEAARRGLTDGQNVKLKIFSQRSLVFDDVVVRVSDQFAPWAHIDCDEANACALRPGDLGLIVHG